MISLSLGRGLEGLIDREIAWRVASVRTKELRVENWLAKRGGKIG